MMNWLPFFTLAQQPAEGTFRSVEYSLPEHEWQWFLYGIGLIAVIAYIIWMYRKDTQEISIFWRFWLVALRLGVVAALVVIAINPEERTQKMSFRPSEVIILVDTSTSMQNPVDTPGPENASKKMDTRAEAVTKLLEKSDLIADLQKKHTVTVYTFDRSLQGPQSQFISLDPRLQKVLGKETSSDEADGDGETPVKEVSWKDLIAPRGVETRIGDAISEALTREAGRTLAGVIIISDGAVNAGVNPVTIAQRAQELKTRVFTVGVGGTTKPTNLEVAKLLAPTDVQLGDAFEISAFVQGQGMAGRFATVELLSKTDNEEEPLVVETREVQFNEDGVPVELKFEQTPQFTGETNYIVRIKPNQSLTELRQNDNEKITSVTAFDRPTRVLVVAGGPMWDYRFMRTALYRHKSTEVDVWLQSGTVGISQESDNLLFAFPSDKAELFDYDVIVSFDADWSLIEKESRELIEQWVVAQGGGIVFVAGDVFTPLIAADPNEFSNILALHPVFLQTLLLDFRTDDEGNQPWPLELTQEGRDAGFMHVTEDPITSEALWLEFPGVFRNYPTAGPKASASVYAFHDNPAKIDEFGKPIVFASQFYGQGRSFFIGSPEMYRLRSEDPEHLERFWTKLIRTVGQGRLKRGADHAAFLLESTVYSLGQTVGLRARVVDPQYEPLQAENVEVVVTDPDGKPIVPNPKLVPDPNRPGEFVGSFRGNLPGRYKIQLPVPNLEETAEEAVDIILPQLEDKELRQNVKLLRDITVDTGGKYVALNNAAESLPDLIPNRGEEFLIAERLRTLWDKQWVMFLMAGLLSAEWLTRKLLRLA